MAYRSSSNNQGNSTTLSTTVPTGAATDDIALLWGTIDRPSDDFTTLLPSGFTKLFTSNGTHDGQSMFIAYKRLTGADSGSYTCSAVGGASYWICQAALWSGRHTTNNPAGTANVNNTGNSNPVTVTGTGLTATAGDDLAWVSLPDVKTADIGNGHTAPTGFTERQDIEEVWSNASMASLDNHSGGSTGDISGTFAITSSTAGYVCYLIRIPAAGGGGAPPAGRTLTSMGIGR